MRPIIIYICRDSFSSAIYKENIKILAPTFVVSMAFLVLALPFDEQNYVWVEPGMFAFYFLAICGSGLVIAHSRNAAHYTIDFRY